MEDIKEIEVEDMEEEESIPEAEMMISLMIGVQNKLIYSALTAFTYCHQHIAKMLCNENIKKKVQG